MTSFEFNVTFEDGVVAGRAVVDVAKRCSDEPAAFPVACDLQELEDVFQYAKDRGKGRRLPYIEGFLSQVVRRQSSSDSILELWGVDHFVDNQSRYAPICNLPKEFQMIQFGSWCGELSDGDGWCIDFYDELIRCVPIGCGDEHGIDYLKRCTYGCFPTLRSLAPYLLSVAETRTYCQKRMAKHARK